MWPSRVTASEGPGTPTIMAGGKAGRQVGLHVDGPGGWHCFLDMVTNTQCRQVTSACKTPYAQITYREEKFLYVNKHVSYHSDFVLPVS